ncbi:unnamed protein product [Vitrella brassicaformis CCMP3155]|uniref:Uncharacterized protein n=1 Tax=Vitrella brassicaformis (strain CCMP3155) TaxID=1169540 RepID=A0A0G4EWB0_VITBC|nr:unnamed protein product [Vitrella brassicaformis CCMP3155]|eukprot:CEM02635.1 unnamed protein product [Vitrella brassicaformis CCMP3155]
MTSPQRRKKRRVVDADEDLGNDEVIFICSLPALPLHISEQAFLNRQEECSPFFRSTQRPLNPPVLPADCLLVDSVCETVWAFPHADVTEEVVREPGNLFVGDRRFHFDNSGERRTVCRVCGTHGRAADDFITQHYYMSTAPTVVGLGGNSRFEGILEVLWLSDTDRTGIGGYLGFVECVKSLSGVSTAIASIVDNPKMHPILLLESTKRHTRAPQAVHKKWKEVLSRTNSIRVLIKSGTYPLGRQLLEAAAASVTEVIVDTTADRRSCGDIVSRAVTVALLEAAAPNVTGTTVDSAADRTIQCISIAERSTLSFPRLVKAVLTREWLGVMQRQIDRKQVYEMPALTHLSVEWPAHGGLTMLKGLTGGLRSLHLLNQVSADGQPVYTPLETVVHSLLGTPSQATIKSLTGAITLNMYPEAPDLSGLECLEVAIGAILTHANSVQKLHEFRDTWLAKGAKELYHTLAMDSGRLRLVRRATSERPAPVQIQLPLIGKPEQLAGTRETLHFSAASAIRVFLSPYFLNAHATGASELYGLSFKQAADLYVTFPEGMTEHDPRHPLPVWITESAHFGTVKTLLIDHRGGPMGVSLYGGGVDKVISRLPKLARVGFMRRPITTTNWPRPVVPLVWAGLKHCAVEGGPLDVFVVVPLSGCRGMSFVPDFQWQTVEEESHELEAVVKARVRSVRVCLHVCREQPDQLMTPAFQLLFLRFFPFSRNAWSLLTRFPSVERVVLTMAGGIKCSRDDLVGRVEGLGFRGHVSVEGDRSVVFRRERPVSE